MENQFKTLAVAANESAAHQVNANIVAVEVTTTESSAIVVKTSLDGVTYATNANFSETLDGTAVYNLTDLAVGQYVKIAATSGTLQTVKIIG